MTAERGNDVKESVAAEAEEEVEEEVEEELQIDSSAHEETRESPREPSVDFGRRRSRFGILCDGRCHGRRMRRRRRRRKWISCNWNCRRLAGRATHSCKKKFGAW